MIHWKIVKQNINDPGDLQRIDGDIVLHVPQHADNKEYQEYLAFLKSGGKPEIIIINQKNKGDFVAHSNSDALKDINDGLKSIAGLMQMLPDIKARLEALENKK